MIIRDAFGRQQSINLGFYLSTQLLKKGEQDYSYLAGLERTSTGTNVEDRARDGDGSPQHRPRRLVDDRLPG